MRIPLSVVAVVAVVACMAGLLAAPLARAESGAKSLLEQLPKLFSGNQTESVQPPVEEPWPSPLWKPIHLGAGVIPAGPRHTGIPSDAPRCRRIGEVVYLEGMARAVPGPEGHVFLGTLPEECMRRAPWQEISFDIPALYQNAIFELNIRQNAINVYVRRAEATVTSMYVSLYGISYPVE